MVKTMLRMVWVGLFVWLGGVAVAASAVVQTNSTQELPVCPVSDAWLRGVSPFFEEDQMLFAATWELGVFPPWGGSATLWRSSDGSVSWGPVHLVTSTQTTPALVLAPIPPVPSGQGLFLYLRYELSPWGCCTWKHSVDSGDTWGQPYTPVIEGGHCGVSVTNEPGTLFAGCSDDVRNPDIIKGIYRSGDHGLTWQPMWTETANWGVAPSPDYASDQTVFAVRGDFTDNPPQLMVSQDGGVSWEDRTTGLCQDDPWINNLEVTVSPDFSHDQTLFGVARSHLLKSEDAGNTWQNLYPPDVDPCEYPDDAVSEIILSPDYAIDNTIFMDTAPAYNRSYLYVSYDGGNHWRSLLGPHAPWNIQIRRRPQDTVQVTYLPLLLRGVAAELPAIHRIYLPLTPGSGALPKAMPLTLFARATGGKNIYYRSDDGGVSWRCLNLPSPASGGS